jgi:hypothetical protein
MKSGKTLTQRLRAAARGIAKATLGAAAALGVALAWSFLAASPESLDAPHAQQAQAGWGAEAITEIRDAMRTVSPIAEANACGMGASSCFKCHNGTRSKAPPPDKWHTDHKAVDNSCGGCHKGNARLIKVELAHKDMVKDPRAQHVASCAGCHKGGDTAQLAAKYAKK